MLEGYPEDVYWVITYKDCVRRLKTSLLSPLLSMLFHLVFACAMNPSQLPLSDARIQVALELPGDVQTWDIKFPDYDVQDENIKYIII